MSNYRINSHISQPCQRQIYHLIFNQLNLPLHKQSSITRKWLKDKLFYALSTLSDALQELRKLGLITYNSTTKTWKLITRAIKSHTIKHQRKIAKKGSTRYDNYILYQWDTWQPQYDTRTYAGLIKSINSTAYQLGQTLTQAN